MSSGFTVMLQLKVSQLFCLDKKPFFYEAHVEAREMDDVCQK